MSIRRFRNRRPAARLGGAAVAAVPVAAVPVAAVALTQPTTHAYADTLFGDDFEDGNATGWSTSGGTWTVVTDGSRAYRQSGTSSDARALAGQSSWTDHSVSVKVKPTTFNGTNRFVALLARARSNTSYYYLALRSNNTVELNGCRPDHPPRSPRRPSPCRREPGTP